MEQHKLQKEYGIASSLYGSLENERSSLEGDWKECSSLTLPYIFPEEHMSESTRLETPYNSIGPSAVNILASKLLLALLPPTGKFFRLLPDEDKVEGLSKEELDNLDKELGKLEQDVNELISIQALRVPLYEAIKLLIVTGNTMIYKVKGGGIKVFNPYQYVVQRDYAGTPTTMLIKERVAKKTLPNTVMEQIKADIPADTKEHLDVYTHVYLIKQGKYGVHQEICGHVIEATIKTYTTDKLPYLPLRWTSINNEDYGRGLTEQYLGDLRALEELTRLIVEGSGVMAKTVFGLKPASSTKLEDVMNAQNGDFVSGDLEKDITTLQVAKSADMQIPFNLVGQIEARLSRAFLMVGGQIRDSERTTATEVRAVANELEAALGGTFSVLSQELQLPLITLLLDEMEPQALKVTSPTIVTGISAISRERDFQNLNTLLQSMMVLGPEVLNEYLDVSSYLSKVAISLGMEPEEIVKSSEQRQREKQQQMMMQQQMMQQQQQNDMQQIEAKKGD